MPTGRLIILFNSIRLPELLLTHQLLERGCFQIECVIENPIGGLLLIIHLHQDLKLSKIIILTTKRSNNKIYISSKESRVLLLDRIFITNQKYKYLSLYSTIFRGSFYNPVHIIIIF